MSRFISYNSYKNNLVINETYESYVELKILAKDIFDAFKKGKIEANKIYYIQLFTNKTYKVINNLLSANIGIIFTSKEYGEPRGTFIGSDEYSKEEAKQYKAKYPNGYIIIRGEVYFDTLVHELQHAYDSLRSNGKYSYSKIGYKQRDLLEKPYKWTYRNEEERDKQFKEYSEYYMKLYHRSPHEISAKFSGTLSNIKFFYDENEIYLRNFNDVYDEFKEKFPGYEYLTPKDKKILARKFSQYYYKLKERNIYNE